MASSPHAVAQLPVPGTPPAAQSPGQRGPVPATPTAAQRGSWDPGWPPASAQSSSPAGKRSRPLGVPTPGVAIGAEELHGTITKLIEMANDHATRVEALERDLKLIADGVGAVGRHCQSETADIRGHLAASVSDLGKVMQAMGRDEKELMARTEAALVQLGAKAQEHERVVSGVVEKVDERFKEISRLLDERFKEVQHEMQKKQPTEGPGVAHRDAWVGGVGAAYGPSYYDMSSPAKEATAPQTPARAAAPDGGWTNWQQGGQWRWQQDGQQGASTQAPKDSFDPWQRAQSAPAWQPSGGAAGPWQSCHSGGAAGPWPARTWSHPTLTTQSKIFEVKYAQFSENMFDGDKDGEHWKGRTRNYFCGFLPAVKSLLEWAEGFGKNEITQRDVEGLRNFFDEDPVVISHLMWSYFNANLTGAAMEIFNNVSDFQGLEVWRKMSQKINVWGERRRDELAEVVNNPKPAGKPEDLAKMIEAWDTSHRQFLACGGQALMEYDRLRILRKMVPQQLLNEMIARDFKDYQAAKEWALEMARRLVVQGRHSKLLLAEAHTITDEFMERTEGWDFDQQLQELGAAGEADVILALVARRTT